jgi:hypothetical protein
MRTEVGRSVNARAIVVLALGLGLALALLLRLGRGRVERSPRAFSSVEASTDAVASRLAALPSPARETLEPVPAPSGVPLPDGPTTARAFLAAYYGANWPDVEARLEAAGQSLDVPYVFTPWEEVMDKFEERIGMSAENTAQLVRDRVRWPEQLTPEYVAQRFQLREGEQVDEADLVHIEELVAEKHREITALAEHYCDLVDYFVHERFRRGDVVRAPYTTAGLDPTLGFHSQSHGGHGWAVTITLTREQYPEIEPLEDRMLDLAEERDQEVVAYLRQRFGR